MWKHGNRKRTDLVYLKELIKFGISFFLNPSLPHVCYSSSLQYISPKWLNLIFFKLHGWCYANCHFTLHALKNYTCLCLLLLRGSCDRTLKPAKNSCCLYLNLGLFLEANYIVFFASPIIAVVLSWEKQLKIWPRLWLYSVFVVLEGYWRGKMDQVIFLQFGNFCVVTMRCTKYNW